MVARSKGRSSADSRGPVSVLLGGFGEILLTFGVVVLLFVAWQLWWTNLEAAHAQDAAVGQTVHDWAQQGQGKAPTHPIEGSVWGILYVPRFGAGYAKPVAEGVGLEVLNTVGVGHYPQTQMPGRKGNVALAGHRQTHGEVFSAMDKLGPGDKAYLQTIEGTYTYTYRNTKIVYPSQGEVVFPVPGDASAEPTQKLLTLTTCHPPFTTDMRMVVHLEQSKFTPVSKPAPAAIRDLVQKTTGVGEE